MIAEPDGVWSADLHDGRSARRHRVEVTLEGNVLEIARADGERERVPLADLARRGAGRDGDRLVRPAVPGWRLDFSCGVPAVLEQHVPAPANYGGWIDRFGLWRASVGFAALSVALVATVLAAPEWVAPLIPHSVEKRMGAAMVGDFAEATCHTPAGDAALAHLVQELDLPDQPPVQPQVVRFGMVNALALPGDRIVLFSGLFDDVKDPDAIAGVVAHELGHVRKRHVLHAVLRELGISVVMAGTSGAVPQQLAQITGLRYSRAAEAEADAFARDRLASARISPLMTAQFFSMLATQEPDARWAAMLNSHPPSQDRAAAFRASLRPNVAYHPALSLAEWHALSRICADDKAAKPLLGW